MIVDSHPMSSNIDALGWQLESDANPKGRSISNLPAADYKSHCRLWREPSVAVILFSATR